jgi:hypothetical protein
MELHHPAEESKPKAVKVKLLCGRFLVTYNQTRQCSSSPNNGCTVPVGMNISNNTIKVIGTSPVMMGASSSNNGSTTSWQVSGMFDSNTYCVPSLPWSNANWQMGTQGVTAPLNFGGWQANGQDVRVTLVAGVCSGLMLRGTVKLLGSVKTQ